MSELFSLTCPTCGASLQVAGEYHQFHCMHCGNKYLLSHKVREIEESVRQHLTPVVTYTEKLGQWLRVAEYDVILLKAWYEKIKDEKFFYIEVGYENRISAPIKYRHDQWIVFDADGHTFEPVKDFIRPDVYTHEKIYLGMTRVLTPNMRLQGWLAFLLPQSKSVEYIQFSAGNPVKSAEFRIID